MAQGILSGFAVGAVVAVVGVGGAVLLMEPTQMEPLPDNVTIAGREGAEGTEAAETTEAASAAAASESGADPVEDNAEVAQDTAAETAAETAQEPENAEPAPETAAQDAATEEETDPEPANAVEPAPEEVAEAVGEGSDGEEDQTVEAAAATEAPENAPSVSELKSTTPPNEGVLGGGADMAPADAATEVAEAEVAALAEPAETEDAAPLEDTGLFTEVAPEDVMPDAPAEDPDEPAVMGADTPEDERLAVATPPVGLPKTDIVTDRLPRIGDEPAAESAAAPSASSAAIDRNAIAFIDPGDAPKMSLLLLDTGADRSQVGDLSMLPFPLTVAVDASRADAEEAIAFYRKAGAEVVVIVPLPEGATATDVDVTFQAYAPLIDQAVAVMMEENLGFQSLGPGAAQVVTNVSEQGLGLISYQQGLNTAHKLAQKEEVPAGQIFTDLDGEGQTGAVIRRFLDNVAFKARNADGVVALARVTPESVQALLEWSLGNRAQSVVLAPVSKTLPR